MKALFKILIAIVVVLVVGLIGVYFARNVIAASVIRSAASSVLGVPVDVDSVDVSVFGGTADLQKFAIGNPPGYKAPHVLTAGKIHVALNASESNTSKLVVDEVRLDDIDAFFIAKGNTNNVSELTDSLQGSGDTGKGGESVEILIKKFVLTNLRAHASVTNDGPGDPLATVPEIVLTNISTKGGTEDITRQLSAKIFEVTMQATFEAVGKQLPGAIADGVGKSLDSAGVIIGDTAKMIGDSAGKAFENAAKGIGDLLGGKKDK